MGENMRFFGFLKDSEPPQKETWKFSLSKDALAQVNQISLVNTLQSDYRQSQDSITDSKDTQTIEEKAKGKFLQDIIRTKHLISGNQHYYITHEQPDMESIEAIKQKAGDKKLKFLVIDKDNEDVYYNYLKDDFSKKYGKDMANHLLANLHQDGLLSIGRSYVAANAQMNQQDILKTSNATIEIKKQADGSVAILEGFDVDNILVMGDEGPVPISKKPGPIASIQTLSSLKADDKGHITCQIEAMTFEGQSSMRIKHKLEEGSKPGQWPSLDQKSKASP